MLVVISDLHLEECSLGVHRSLRVNRNLDPQTYEHFIRDLAEDARVNHAKSVDLVLAGDVFELNRSYIWYEDHIKPYVNVKTVTPGSEYEKRILRLLDLIGQEERVAKTLEVFRNLQSYFSIELRLHYLLGNHDRLVNATPAIRRKARELLGMPAGDELLPHTFMYYSKGKPLAFVRHGQEYDPMNFSENYKFAPLIPAEIPLKEYEAPPVDDFSAVEIVYKLPYMFVEHYGAQAILQDEKLLNLYHRLVEFQDVRPQSALINYIFNSPGFTRRQVWQYLEPVILDGLNALRKDPFLKSPAMKGNLLKTFLRLNPWRKSIPFRLVKRFSSSITKRIGRNERNLPAVKEEVLQKNGDSVRCIISGHTHQAQVALMDAEDGVERYYFNSGTWRNVVPVSPNLINFGHIETLSNVVIYGADENREKGEKKATWSFDFSAGFSQKFSN
jgi:UDP-2,3-diacylglucosamine pyrophosphatase LpxH